MKFNRPQERSSSRSGNGLDATDRAILELLQENCKQPLATIGAKVGLTAPAVFERIHKLEQAGIIRGYAALLDARCLGLDVTAFIGVGTDQPSAIGSVEAGVSAIDEVLECHHVTGLHTFLLKAKTANTESLEELIDRIRSLPGVARTETLVVLSTHTERQRISLADQDAPPAGSGQRGGARRRAAK